MKPRVYVETSVVSYLTAQPSRDIVVAGRQQVTREWWATAAARFELVVSGLVRQEAMAGNPEAADGRLAVLESVVERVEATPEAQELTERLVVAGAFPAAAVRDAAHVAIAAANGVEYVLTWNFRHLANAVVRPRIEAVCRDAGFEPPVICTPEELIEVPDDGRRSDRGRSSCDTGPASR